MKSASGVEDEKAKLHDILSSERAILIPWDVIFSHKISMSFFPLEHIIHVV